MTGNQIKGKGFRGALRYNLEKVGKGIAQVLDHTFVNVSEKSIMKEVQMVRILKPNLQKYFYHTSINFPPDENLPNDKMKQIGLDYLNANGFDQHQFIMFRHYDADHPHLHILVNRIGYDGKVLSDSNDFARSEKVLRELEEKYNLTKVISSREAKERAMTKDELEMMKRTNAPSQKLKLQIIIRSLLQGRPGMTTEQFIKALEGKQINVLFNQASTGYVSGISYGYQGIVIKGAKLGKDFKWTSIINRINYEQERDRAAIHQANDRATSINVNIRASTDHPKGDSRSLHQSRTKRLSTIKPSKDFILFNPGYSIQRSTDIPRSQSVQGTDISSKGFFPEKSKSSDLASLLDGNSHGDPRQPDNLPMDIAPIIRSKKRKKRRRRR